MEDLKRLAADCTARGAAQAEAVSFDARKPATFAPLIDRLAEQDGMLSAAVFLGTTPEPREIDTDPALIDGTVTDSFTGPARFLHMMAPLIEARGGGTVVGVGSVAGDRGRAETYVPWRRKGRFSHISFGPAQTANARRGTCGHGQTRSMSTPPAPGGSKAWCWPPRRKQVANDILKAVDRRRDVIYTPFFWRYVMAVIRIIPERIFKRLPL